MSNLVIVAIPDENDRVWKVSSEKIPHLTVLFLGDVDQISNLETIVQFVEHAANTTLRRFYLPVDRRGELGEDKADVLFFKKGRYDYKAIRDFRAALLQDSNIKTAYDSAKQFEGPWNPHLTLGYPADPANPDGDKPDHAFYETPFYEVHFNRIAVWTGDFDGPEFLLKDFWDEFDALESVPMDVAMSDIAHYGVKGMHWGQHKADVASGARSVGKAAKSTGGAVGKAAGATSRFVKDVNFESRVKNGKAREAVIDSAQKPFLKQDLPVVKARHGDYGKLKNRAKKPFSKEARAYRKDAKETYIKRLEDTANSMKNASGTREYTIRERGSDAPAQGGALPASKFFWDVSSRHVAHAATDEFTRLELVMDAEGWITDLKPIPIEDSLIQTIDLGEAFLVHYGVKGMKWGVRKDRQGRDRFSPEGYSTGADVAKAYLIPVGGIPAAVRLAKRYGAQRKEAKWEKSFKGNKKLIDVHNKAADHMDEYLKTYNADKRWKDQDGNALNLNNHPDKLKEYDAGYFKESEKAYGRATAEVYGTSPSGAKKVSYDESTGYVKLTLDKSKAAKHAADDVAPETITARVIRDVDGYIVDLIPIEDSSAAHASDLGAAFVLEHYGIKGMHWGQRKARTVSTQAHVDSGLLKRKTKLQTTGGESHPAHQDAVEAAVQKQKIKKSGTNALSTQELRDLANRLQVENQVSILMSSKGKQFVSKELEKEGKAALKVGARKAAPHVVKRAGKGAATVATIAALL